jgi:hypothetical protein
MGIGEKDKMRKSIVWAAGCMMVVLGLYACGGGGSSSEPAASPQEVSVVGNWEAANGFSITFMTSNKYIAYESGALHAWGPYDVSGNQLTVIGDGGAGSCEGASGLYQVNNINDTLSFTLVSDPCSGREYVLTSGPWTKRSTGYAYYEIYGARAGDYTLTTSGHPLIGSSKYGNSFNVAGYARFILYVPSTSAKILFDAIGLGTEWVNSQSGAEYAHYANTMMNPTNGTWSQGDRCIEGAPDGITMENTVGSDAYYGFSTNATSTLTVYVKP